MIDKLRVETSESATRALVVIDAGITTEENLELIKNKGYDYICVSRSNLKKYKEIVNSYPVTVRDNKARENHLTEG